MKKGTLVTLLSLLLACLMLAACGSSPASSAAPAEAGSTSEAAEASAPAVDDTSAEAAASGEKFKVGYISAAFFDDFSKKMADFTLEYQNTEFTDMEIEVLDGNNEVAKMIECMETFMTKGVDAMIIQPIAGIDEAVKMFDEANIPVVYLNMEPVFPDGNKDYYYAGASDYNTGSQQAEVMADALDEDATVCICLLPLGNQNTVDRRDGFVETMAELRPDVQIIDEQSAGIETAMAMSITEDWLQRFGSDGIDLIVAQSNMQTSGIIEVLKSHDLIGKIKIASISCPVPEGFDWVASGEVYLDMFQNPQAEAKAALEITRQLLNGETPAEKHVFVPTEPITAENAEARKAEVMGG